MSWVWVDTAFNNLNQAARKNEYCEEFTNSKKDLSDLCLKLAKAGIVYNVRNMPGGVYKVYNA